ncbi:MAG: cache domain-containing protein [bacterium]|nr:cache domain-containing protein [bacterium]MDD5757024.1 cache domain-containing protein [bacterium]
MKTRTLKSKILYSFLSVILVLGISIALLGFYVIKKDIIERAQQQVKNDLQVAHMVYTGELDSMKQAFSVIRYITTLEELKSRLGLDYLYIIDVNEGNTVPSEIARQAARGRSLGGTRVIGKDELQKLDLGLVNKCRIDIHSTPKAKPSDKKVLEQALALEYARPLVNEQGKITKIIYGGKIINCDLALVDKIRDYVFENRLYGGKPIGTVTIFLDDTRIATNVLDNDGKRAIGTLISENVYENVMGKGRSWLDRAFVVTDWYLTGYEPIRSIDGKIIGILYVGILEKPFNDMRRNILLAFLAILLLGTVLAVILSVILDVTITKPFTRMTEATGSLAAGDLDHRIKAESKITELDQLAESFNEMAKRLQERDANLKETNEKLAALNKSYMDLVGFVSHELKGILGSIVMNIYSIKEGYLGPLNEKQQKAMNSAARTLDHFETMVKNYLDLSRIEKGELEIKPTAANLAEDIIKPALAHFEKQIQEKNLQVTNLVLPGIKLSVDKNLLLIVCDNLLGNACKYSQTGARIIVEGVVEQDHIKVSVYNEGTPIKDEQQQYLFKKFSRLEGSEKIRGTGIGLYITRQIIEKHQGKIWAEAKPDGNSFIFILTRSLG